MTKRDVARNTPALWRALDAGTTVAILDRGKPRYKIVALAPAESPLDRMRALGLVHDASPSDEPLRAIPTVPTVLETVMATFERDRAR